MNDYPEAVLEEVTEVVKRAVFAKAVGRGGVELSLLKKLDLLDGLGIARAKGLVKRVVPVGVVPDKYPPDCYVPTDEGREFLKVRRIVAKAAAREAKLELPKVTGSAKSVEALMDKESEKILHVVHSDLTSDDKMEAIFKIDHTCLAWSSRKWHDLLGVTTHQIRKNHFWTHTRLTEIAKLDR